MALLAAAWGCAKESNPSLSPQEESYELDAPDGFLPTPLSYALAKTGTGATIHLLDELPHGLVLEQESVPVQIAHETGYLLVVRDTQDRLFRNITSTLTQNSYRVIHSNSAPGYQLALPLAFLGESSAVDILLDGKYAMELARIIRQRPLYHRGGALAPCGWVSPGCDSRSNGLSGKRSRQFQRIAARARGGIRILGPEVMAFEG